MDPAFGMNRRDLLRATGLGALALSLGCATAKPAEAEEKGKGGEATVAYALPVLPYDAGALAPHLEEMVIRLHHGKHHAGYVRGLNATLDKLALARKENAYSAIKSLSRDLAFHGSGHVLHSLYWTSMRPGDPSKPAGALAKALVRDFGSLKGFETHFKAATKKVEGSGWSVLAWEPLGRRLIVLQAEKHQNLAIWGAVPLMVCDVWEHAYYAQYQNRRGAYVDAFWRLVDWPSVGKRFAAVMG